MTLKRCAVVLFAVLGGAACDLVAGPGQTLTLGDGGNVFGTGGNAQRGPLPAVTVQPTGTVVVRNSSLFGGGVLVQQPNQRAFLFAGAGIDVTDGTVRVEQGVVAGGPVVLQVPASGFDLPEAGIIASGASFVDILGGTVRGGSFISQVGMVNGEAAPGMDILGGGLRVSGGTISPGVVDPPTGDSDFDFSVTTSDTDVHILGGNFTGGVAFGDGRARISGGTFRFLFVLNEDGQACAELRGGQINEFDEVPGIIVSNRARLIVAGTGLMLRSIEPAIGLSQLTGTLQNGQPINASVVTDTGGFVQLVGPGGPGCP